MNLIKLNIKFFLSWAFLIIINYFLILFLIYILSAILLVNKITPNIPLINEYQRNFYTLGLWKIWHSQPECIEFSDKLIYAPKETSCNFSNIEFSTKISFDRFGRVSDHPVNSNNTGIAVLGDSHAMGWGVNDNETFSYLLEKKINRPVYNLAVSGYGTVRELIRLQESGLIDSIDTIIFQYCYNDHGENIYYKKTSKDIAKEKYNLVKQGGEFSIWKKLRKSFRYSIKIAGEVIFNKKRPFTFDHHNETFIQVLKKFDFLKDKRIIVFYVNGHQQEFSNFPSGKSKDFNNLEYIDLNIEEDISNFYLIDGHLNSTGHMKIAERLSKFF